MSSDKASTENGFTLLEVLVAVTILGIAYLAVLQSFSVSMRNISKVDTKRQQMFSSMLIMENQFSPLSDPATEDEKNLPVFIKGQKYKLLLMTDENDAFVTLKLEKR
ncbi:MAG: type II secretion system GspH family protein [Proteobacteria bacterium]|nr:type II secretion system GspH family protein [Pseudomonadota bacterium]MBU1716617.1 type II secretion system GspH family protein [Pseudomonadota bacterium]